MGAIVQQLRRTSTALLFNLPYVNLSRSNVPWTLLLKDIETDPKKCWGKLVKSSFIDV